jgi:hypothetical protein
MLKFFLRIQAKVSPQKIDTYHNAFHIFIEPDLYLLVSIVVCEKYDI